MLAPAQLKSRGSFCRKHSRPGRASAGYRWFMPDSVLSQGTCSLGGTAGSHHSARGREQAAPGQPPPPASQQPLLPPAEGGG